MDIRIASARLRDYIMLIKNVIERFTMRLFRLALPLIFLILAPFLSFVATAQDMDTIEGVYRQQYEQYTIQESRLRQEMENLSNLKSQIDSLIAQVGNATTTNYAQESDRYRQIQLLLPSAIQYSHELEQRDKQITDIERRKSELKSQILERQSTLPIWWTE